MSRIKTMNCRLTKKEYSDVEKRANELSISISDFMRLVLLNVFIGSPEKINKYILQILNADENRTEIIQCRVKDEEYNKIVCNASQYSLSISDYIRVVGLKSTIKIEI